MGRRDQLPVEETPVIHGDPLPFRRGALLPAIRWGQCLAVSLQRAQSWGSRGARCAESWASMTSAVGSRSIAVPGHVDGSTSDDGGRVPPLRALPPKPVTPSGHEDTPGKSSLRGSLPDTRAALLKTAQVRRFPDTEKRLQPQGAWRGVKTVSTGILDGFWGTQGTRVENG